MGKFEQNTTTADSQFGYAYKGFKREWISKDGQIIVDVLIKKHNGNRYIEAGEFIPLNEFTVVDYYFSFNKRNGKQLDVHDRINLK